jgi:hypothetical protein
MMHMVPQGHPTLYEFDSTRDFALSGDQCKMVSLDGPRGTGLGILYMIGIHDWENMTET